MIHSSIKYYQSDGIVVKAKMKVEKNDGVIKVLTIGIGDELVVKPLNKLKLKHRDRRVKVLKFIDNGQVSVKFLDNNRTGKVEIDDLDSCN